MKKILIAITLFYYSGYVSAQDSVPSNLTRDVKTASGIVRGLTEGEAAFLEGFLMLHHLWELIVGNLLNQLQLGKR